MHEDNPPIDPMNQKDKLKEEAEYWLTYINDWKNNHDEPVPERALTQLDNALLKLKTIILKNAVNDE